MQKNILFGFGGLLIGLVIGFFAANNINRNAVVTQNQTPNSQIPQTQNVSVKEPNRAMITDVTQTLEKAKKEPENFDAQMNAGDMYAQIQRNDKAAEFFSNAEALKPNDYEKIVKLGNAYFDIGQYEKAEKFYLQALEKKSDDVNVRTDLGITFLLRQTPDLDRSVKEFSESLRINPNHEPTLYNMALAYFKKGSNENAQKYLNQLEKVNPNSELVSKLKQNLQVK
jgi:tetratricopeptide (TPR) repeat protein